LIEVITDYIEKHNENPQTFTWTAKAQTVLEKIRRARAVLNKMASI
jgi:hypothetical protein